MAWNSAEMAAVVEELVERVRRGAEERSVLECDHVDRKYSESNDEPRPGGHLDGCECFGCGHRGGR